MRIPVTEPMPWSTTRRPVVSSKSRTSLDVSWVLTTTCSVAVSRLTSSTSTEHSQCPVLHVWYSGTMKQTCQTEIHNSSAWLY